MQILRFQSQNIYVVEKSVEFCGKNVTKSKKRVKWVIKHGENIHYVNCTISFYSGKKKVTHNGHVIMNITDSKQSLDVVVLVGNQRMIFMVQQDSQQATVERKYLEDNDQFAKFQNIFSQPITKIYEKLNGEI